MELSPAAFDELRRAVHGLCGLAVGADKAYLVRHRLGPLAEECGCRTFEEFAARLRGPGGPALGDRVVEAITTGETSFFRDGHPFEAFRRHLLPRMAEAARARAGGGRPRVRLWVAGAATGQEAYSVAMLAHDYAAEAPAAPEFHVLATDVSGRALAAAAAAAYRTRDLVRGLTPAQVVRYFEQRGDHFVVRGPVRRLVEFRRVNLARPLAGLGPFDAVFCRNVLIYFDEATRRRVVGQLHALLADGGWLVLGSAENLYGISDRFQSVRFGESLVYRKGGPGA